MQSMPDYLVKTQADGAVLPKEDQLAWKIARTAATNDQADDDVLEMIGNRLLDNAAVALAAINRDPVRHARLLALGYPHPHQKGATLFGLDNRQTFHCEWTALANGVAVRELDMHDTYLAADYSHPGDTIPPLLATAQQTGASGRDLALGILTAYETQMALVTGICLHEHKIDHVAHLAPAVAAGIGTMLHLSDEQIFQAINQSLHLACATRQSRKGEITSWKAYAPAQAGKTAIEAVGRARLGERSPSPIYEGRDGVIAWMLSGPDATYTVPLPAPGEPLRAILRSYTKEHSAEYQAQALIDIGFALHARQLDLAQVKRVDVRTSHHTHNVIGTGANDPQKMDPNASRETLDHSAMYILAVAWQDGAWHHVRSYTPERAQRPTTVELWHKIRTSEAPEWTSAYHDHDPAKKKFGAEVVVHMQDGTQISERLDNPNAHYLGAHPFQRPDYINKLAVLTEEVLPTVERKRFIDLVERLPQLSSNEVRQLNPVILEENLEDAHSDRVGIL
jgi:2-methylcitrate dehydratase